MREVMLGLIDAEREARGMVDAARAEGERVVSRAEQSAREMAALARQEIRAEAAQVIETAVESARREKRERMEKAALEINNQVLMDEETRNSVVEEVVRSVCT